MVEPRWELLMGPRPPNPTVPGMIRELLWSPGTSKVLIEMDDLRKWTLPSANRKLATPGWLLLAPAK